jgi:tRNA-2-methylthio-N6-dimethylallyladenosine synthase
MGRQYTIEHYLERLERIRSAVPGIAVSTDIIVGFCAETDAQFESTLRLLERVRYDQVFAAAFSPRPGTPAARLPDDVPPAVKRQRLHTLLELQEGIGLERNRAWLGRDVEVLVDTIVPPRGHDHDAGGESVVGRPATPVVGEGSPVVHLSGRSRGNKLVHLTGAPALIGQFVTVRVDHAGPYALRGRLA